MLIAGDVYRPAAIEQLKVLGSQVNIPVYTEDGNTDPVKIAQNGIKEAKRLGHDLVIVDTAGRLAIDAAMMNEIESIKKTYQSAGNSFCCGCNDRPGCRKYSKGI